MNRTRELIFRWAAAVNVVVLGLLALFPYASRNVAIIGEPWNYLLGAVLAVVLAGFHFSMMVDCVQRSRGVLRTLLWVIFLIVLPIASAVVYFIFSRSEVAHFESSEATT
jgi:hypothetical protein